MLVLRLADIFLNNKNELKGRISRNGFIVRKKWHFFDVSSNLAKAKGRFIEDDGRIIVCIQVTGFNWFIVTFCPSFNLPIFFVIIFENGINDSPAILLLPILFILLPYLFVRISVSRLYEMLKKKVN
ncbi:MAG: hypothetical protein IPM82_12490 [Saprospiraceae bacterium]|nr:hypothetical protein [Saprospiraceae bacterium]